MVLAALILAMFVAAIEATIVATAMPSIVAQLGGLALYSWVFSGFLLMQAVTIPIYGKLSDLFGRKPVFLAGLLVFLFGSALCGFAPSMSALVAFRFIQGMGAGSVQSIATTLIGDLYSLEERARIQGYVSSVWGISAIVGPLAGALIVQHGSWPWVFWLNLPFGILTMVLLELFLHEEVKPREASIDYAGAAWLLVSLLALMLGLTQAGRWGVAGAAGLMAAAAAAFALFIRQERRAPDPIMHLELWHQSVIAFANVATLCTGIAMIGVITFMPIYVQSVLGDSALVAGIALCAMSIGWPLASVITGRLLTRVGMRPLARIAGAIVLVAALLVALAIERGAAVAAAGSFIMGVGLGVLNATVIVAIQSSVGWAQRGVATASNMLMRILGNTLGAALFGGVLNFMVRRGAGPSAMQSLQDVLSAGSVHPASLASGLELVFWGVVAFSAFALAACWMIPEHHLGAMRRPAGKPDQARG